MANKKIVFLGGGSLYFTRRLTGILTREDLGGSEIVFYDINAQKLDLIGSTYRRLAEEAGTGFRVRWTTDLADALDGADFAISAIGGSGVEVTPNFTTSYYHTCDIQIPMKYGIYQVIGDTGGPGALLMALHSIPVYVEICREMEKRCPNVIFFNHSNPMAPLCRSMIKYSGVKVIGVCHGVQSGLQDVARLLDVPVHELECVWVGTNHYHWFTRILHRGVDVYDKVMRRAAEDEKEGYGMSNAYSRAYDHRIVLSHDSHTIEFYPIASRIGSFDDLPYAIPKEAARRHKDMDKSIALKKQTSDAIRAEFIDFYKARLAEAKLPDRPDDPITGEGVSTLLSAIAHGRREVFILNLPNNGLISNLPDNAIVELEAVTDSQGARGIQIGECPILLKGMLEKRFAWHELVVDAAVKGDRKLALQALLLDEMAILPDQAEAMLGEMLEASKPLLPRFFED